MRSEIQVPPRTIMEVYKTLPEGTLAELINGTICMSPSPVFNHQNILLKIARQLDDFLETNKSGKVAIAPLDVYLDKIQNAVQPDIVVILNDKRSILNEAGHVHGVPDLLVEVLLKGNSSHDLVTKKALYEKFGVKEYWIVDPETKLAIVFSLTNNVYKLVEEKVGQIDSPLLKHSFSF